MNAKSMRVIEIAEYGGPEVLRIAERPVPQLIPGQVLVRVAAAGVNRPDISQRIGLYPPPPGVTDIPGLDIAGVIEAVGPGVDLWRAGDRVCALVQGGGYAEYCAVPQEQCLPIPQGYGLIKAASLPEVFFTAWNNIIDLGRLQDSETLLIQGGTSGVGVAGIQIAKTLRDARVFATAGTDEKCRVCSNLGAEHVFNYNTQDWAALAKEATGGRGVDLILDSQAGDYTQRELDLLDFDGRLVLIATHRGRVADIHLRSIVQRRLTLSGSTIRPRPPAFKGRIANNLRTHVWPRLASGEIKVLIQRTYALDEAASAHRVLDANEQIGKLVLIVDPAMAD
jgi:NADPH2:quinone reductase